MAQLSHWAQLGLLLEFERTRRTPPPQKAPRSAPSKPVTRRAARSERVIERKAPPTQEEIDRARGYVSKLGGQAKPSTTTQSPPSSVKG